MKIGILIYRQYPYISANTAIGYEIGEELSKRDGCEVVYIGRKEKQASEFSFLLSIPIIIGGFVLELLTYEPSGINFNF